MSKEIISIGGEQIVEEPPPPWSFCEIFFAKPTFPLTCVVFLTSKIIILTVTNVYLIALKGDSTKNISENLRVEA